VIGDALDAATTRRVCAIIDDAARDSAGVFYDPQAVAQRVASACGRCAEDLTLFVVDAGSNGRFTFGKRDDDMADECAARFGVVVTVLR
jgi:hypothetical protein